MDKNAKDEVLSTVQLHKGMEAYVLKSLSLDPNGQATLVFQDRETNEITEVVLKDPTREAVEFVGSNTRLQLQDF